MKKLLAVFFSVLIILSSFPFIAFAEKTEKAETVVTGLCESYNQASSSDLSFTVTVEPADGRTVLLQRYSSEKKKYITKKEFEVKDSDGGEVKLTVPKENRRRAKGKWRIVIPATDTAKRYASPSFTVTSYNIRELDLDAASACVYCIETGQVLYNKNMNAVRKQASTTKIMTAILLIESGKLNKKTKISKKVAETPYGNLNMKKGDVYRNSDLLKAMLVASSNESAAAVAVTVGGTQKKFVKKMNAKAKKLGLKDTVFENPSGLDGKKNHSTAYDLVRMIAYASQYDEFMDAIGTSKYTFKTVKKKEKKTFKTTDTELKSYSKRHLGGKTGYTGKAGCCFASVYKYKEKHYAVAILGCKDDGSRWKDMKKLYKYIDSYSYKKY